MPFPDHIHFLNQGDEPGDRVFINITTRGCGSGCSYCYIISPAGPQVFVDDAALSNSAEALLQSPYFRPGRNGTIVSLCPDSEPFKDERSTEKVLCVLRAVLSLGNPVQIPTKEKVPEAALEVISTHAYPNQVVLFTSFSSLAKAGKIEPRAAPVADRIRNFALARKHGVFVCMYLKPFLPATLKDLDHVLQVLEAERPDAICVGMLYTTTQQQDSAYTHPVHASLTARPLDDDFNTFVAAVKAQGLVPLFHSSVCVTAWALDRIPMPHIWKEYPALCVNCRNCERDLQDRFSQSAVPSFTSPQPVYHVSLP
ncbi:MULTISPECIES: hypothetical protein [Agrobacterium]|jgi:hypothetical protein|uniref:Radical SAM protein n=1 Tax=Agrobacterium tumefaciens TaxID=358 RepID=A0AAW8LYD5_AGRTU|nr:MULTISPECIES: hypothetical protein [Agrobacterium]KAA1233128.1 hypothetical protein FHL81_16825 [Agrobacterium tumefaciens]MBP2566156.1 hypothetical protein [Agrobacterium tumefaciens]MDP9789583.1 hypothetical protein [Agrobacterium tumefaciens]MDP9856398.1 hypothetical protein [Agrobacterium tumefaciens]MDR6704016.1 hypothetical protein [Agrobacterium tumefaciens]